MTKKSVEAVEFGRALQTLVVEAYARGVVVEGKWAVELPAPSVPDWTVEIRQRRPDGGAYTPEFIEE